MVIEMQDQNNPDTHELFWDYIATKIAYESVSKYLNVSLKALYMACADVFSVKYPNTSKNVDELMKQYIEDAEKELKKEEGN